MTTIASVAERAIRLKTDWDTLRATRSLRNRDAAQVLSVSEGDLIAACVGDTAIRLHTRFQEMLAKLESVGQVMALTRNESCVHEKDGVYVNVSGEGHVGLTLGEDIDLRLFFSQWRHGFAVADTTPRGVMRSLQFFDQAGEAVHKVFLREHSDLIAYTALVDEFTAGDQSPGIDTIALPAKPAPLPDDAIDVAGFRDAWANMFDTHEFFGVLKKFALTRTQALRLAEKQFAQAVGLDSARRLLERVSADGTAIMVFVGNPGCIQIHTGPVAQIIIMDGWLNVLDPGFNLHLRQDQIANAWVVRKPTADGEVTSLELFDQAGETIAMFFGKRKTGNPELPEWRTTVAELFPAAAA